MQASKSEETVAIISIGCHLPGGITCLDDLWLILKKEECIVDQVPTSRWSVTDGHVDYAGCLKNVFGFDNQKFGISPKEAYHLDPQHRHLLMRTDEALHSAGINPQALYRSNTGVYIGIGNTDYYQRIILSAEEEIDAYVASGNSPSMAAGRISHYYGFNGPCVAFDTACSSGLYGIHLASQSLQRKECTLAIVGAVNLILTPVLHQNFHAAGMLAVDGKCKVFSEDADGYSRSEGCVVAILTLASHAEKAGYPILGIIKGSATNHDGRTSGITVPHGPSQTAVIKAAIENADITVDEIDYIEAHGTGTRLGDPIEVKALNRIFHNRSKLLPIGSIKANIGHLEIAAGMASLLKALLMLHYREIPKQINCEKLNPHIDWSTSVIEVANTHRAWPHNNQTAMIGVSGFGFSGTNVHLILASSPTQLKVLPRPKVMFNLSHFEVPYKKNVKAQSGEDLPNLYKEIMSEVTLIPAMNAAWFTTLSKRVQFNEEEVVNRYRQYCELLQLLESVCVGYLLAIFKKYYNVNTRDELSNIANHFYLPPLLKPIYSQFLRYMIKRTLSDKTIYHMNEYTAPSREEVEKKFPQFSVEINFLYTCLIALESILTGKIKATDLLFKGGENALALQFYHSTLAGEYFNLQIASIIKDYCETFVGTNRVIRILEIGAGTGATTKYILSHLEQMQVEYWFTDISSYFLTKAKQQFSEFDFIHYAILDLTDNLFADASKKEKFDIIVAANVVHATPSLRKSLVNLHYILASQGILILRECTLPALTADLTFGLTEGWWNFEEDRDRSGHPLIGIEKWCTLLKELDFNMVSSMEAIPETYEYNIIAAKVKNSDENTLNIIFTDDLKNSSKVNNDPHTLILKMAQSKNEYIELFNSLTTVDDQLNHCSRFRVLFCYGTREILLSELTAAWQQTFLSPIYCLQALEELTTISRKVKLYFIREKMKDDSFISSSLTGAIIGLTRVIAIEYPQICGGMFTINKLDTNYIKKIIVEEENSHNRELELVYRNLHRHVRRLVPCIPISSVNNMKIDQAACYLIVGASGGIGMKTMEWLAEEGARFLILISRHLQTDSHSAFNVCCETLQKRGITIKCFNVDISDITGLRHLFAQFDSLLPPLKGVFHSAGVGGDCLIKEIEADTLPQMMQTKILGSYYLHYFTKNLSLDYFVIYSSVMATWGGKYKAHYAAVNAFAIELINERVAKGLPGLIVDWGPWQDVGMLNIEGAEAAQRVGLNIVAAKNYFPLLKQALNTNETHVVIASVDWVKLKRHYSVYHDFHLIDQLTDEWCEQDLNTNLVSVPLEQQDKICYQSTAEAVANILAMTLGYDSHQAIDYDRGFYDQGLDSLMALNFVHTLVKTLNCQIKSVDLFNYPTVKLLAEYIDCMAGKSLFSELTITIAKEQPLQDLLKNIEAAIN